MKTPKKKLVIFMPSMEGGGVEKNTILISNYLAKHINNIEFITYDKKFNKYFDKKIKLTNVVKKSKPSTGKYYKYFKCLCILLSRLIMCKKVYVFSFQANVYCIILSILFGVKLITRSNSSPSGWSKNFIKNFIFRLLLKYPIKVIVNSKKFENEINKKFKINSKMIYNPLNKNEIINKAREKVNDVFFKNKKFLKIINVSRFTDQKDHITLLKAFKIVNNKIKAKLILIGYGSKKQSIVNYIKNNNLSDSIKVINFTFNPYKYIAKSDLFVLTSKYEGLPNVILESMALKKYVISSNCPTGPSEILKNGKYGGLFAIKDYKKLSRMIFDFNNRRKNYNKKISNGYKSLERFESKKNLDKYLFEVNNLMIS